MKANCFHRFSGEWNPKISLWIEPIKPVQLKPNTFYCQCSHSAEIESGQLSVFWLNIIQAARCLIPFKRNHWWMQMTSILHLGQKYFWMDYNMTIYFAWNKLSGRVKVAARLIFSKFPWSMILHRTNGEMPHGTLHLPLKHTMPLKEHSWDFFPD